MKTINYSSKEIGNPRKQSIAKNTLHVVAFYWSWEITPNEFFCTYFFCEVNLLGK